MNNGAPKRNSNAVVSGLYSQHPAKQVIVPQSVGLIDLARYTEDLGDAAEWVADQLVAHMAMGDVKVPGNLVVLYAAVAGEMAQQVAELQGESGIKPSNLGRLDDAQFEVLMRDEAKALALILSQINTAWRLLQEHEELHGQRGIIVVGEKGRCVNPVLNYLAGSMRAAKRLMRDMAANRAWQQRGADLEDTMTERIRAAIEKGE